MTTDHKTQNWSKNCTELIFNSSYFWSASPSNKGQRPLKESPQISCHFTMLMSKIEFTISGSLNKILYMPVAFIITHFGKAIWEMIFILWFMIIFLPLNGQWWPKKMCYFKEERWKVMQGNVCLQILGIHLCKVKWEALYSTRHKRPILMEPFTL